MVKDNLAKGVESTLDMLPILCWDRDAPTFRCSKATSPPLEEITTFPFTDNAGSEIFSFVVDNVRFSKSVSGICNNIFRPRQTLSSDIIRPFPYHLRSSLSAHFHLKQQFRNILYCFLSIEYGLALVRGQCYFNFPIPHVEIDFTDLRIRRISFFLQNGSLLFEQPAKVKRYQ